MTRRNRRLYYLADVPKLPAPLLARLQAEEEQGEPLDFDESLSFQLHLVRLCERMRKERSKWEADHGTVPDVPPSGLL